MIAGLVRLSLTQVHSRYQVATFIIIAATYEILATQDRRPSLRCVSFTGNSLAAFLAIIVVKWRIEGISLTHWADLLASKV